LYNDKTQFAEGRCRHCWDRTELALHAGLEQQFFALFPATRRAMRSGHRARRSRAHTSLEQCAFEWQPESCAINCLPPWLSTRARSSTAEDTCVLCDAEHGKREEQNTWSRTF
jgi:hypothetical protein